MILSGKKKSPASRNLKKSLTFAPAIPFVVEGERERIQAFEGVCIARKNAGVSSAFTVRKIASGEGVERVFPLYSPNVESIVVVRHGRVRRAKLYYLRGRRGRSARIAERRRGVPPKAQ